MSDCVEMHDLDSAVAEIPTPATAKAPFPYNVQQLDMSFSGCGFLGIYHVGVSAAFQHFIPNCRFHRLCGASAGALAAVALVAEIPTTHMVTVLMETAVHARSYFLGPWNPNYNITNVVTLALQKLLPDDIHIRASGRLYVSVTKVIDGSNNVITNFLSKDDLIEAVVSSAFIPFFSGMMPSHFRGQRVIDGGFSTNLPEIFDYTITVSPFAGDAHICPQDDLKYRDNDIHRIRVVDQGHDLTLENLKRLMHVAYPPSPAHLGKILEAGFRDGHRFLRKHGLATCSQCLTIRSQLSTVQDRDDPECKDQLECDKISVQSVRLPQTLENVRDAFKRRTHEMKILKDVKMNQHTLVGQAISLLGNVVYYSPGVVMLRWSFNSSWNATKYLMEKVAAVLPIEDLVNDRRFKRNVEDSVGQAVSNFFPQGRYERVNPSNARPHHTADQPKRRVLRSRIACDIKIHQFGAAEDELDNSPESDMPTIITEDADEVELIAVNVETLDEREVSAPRSAEEACQLQSDNLLAACKPGSITRVTSRSNSRAGSTRNSGKSSRHSSLAGSRRNSSSSLNTESSETLDNIRRVAERQSSIIGYYYTDDNGDMVTLNIYDISDTDPVDILGNDIFGEDGEAGPMLLDPSEVESRLSSMCMDLHKPLSRTQSRESTIAEASPQDSPSDPESDWDQNFSLTSAEADKTVTS